MLPPCAFGFVRFLLYLFLLFLRCSQGFLHERRVLSSSAISAAVLSRLVRPEQHCDRLFLRLCLLAARRHLGRLNLPRYCHGERDTVDMPCDDVDVAPM